MAIKKSTQAAHNARHRADQKLARLPNVKATSYGVKRIAGTLTDEQCYVIYVSQKLPQEQLLKSQNIPKTVRRQGVTIPTDVVEVGRWQRQSAYAVTDGVHQGTVGCFARQDPGLLYALSCAHVLKGSDGVWSTHDVIELWNATLHTWEPIGPSDYMVEGPGRGEELNFGLLDAGLVLIKDERLRRHVHSLPPLRIFHPTSAADIRGLVRQRVSAVSVVSRRQLLGVITGVWMNSVDDQGHRADIVIESTDATGLTNRGDSGLIWYTEAGEAVAIHVLGAEFGPSGASHIAIGSFLFRVANSLDVELLG